MFQLEKSQSILIMLLLVTGSSLWAQEAPQDPLAGRSAGGHAHQLSQVADLFQDLKGISLDQAYSAPAFSQLYFENYAVVRDMQELATQADQIYRRSPQQDLLYEGNVLIHAYMAVAAARVQDVVAYEKHMEIAFKRVSSQQNLTGEQIETAFCTILSTNVPQLARDFNTWAARSTCSDAAQADRQDDRPLDTVSAPTPFEDYRQAAGGAVRLVFDPGPSRALLRHFAVRVADPDTASPQSMIFANWLTNHLRDPIVANWPLDHFLSQWFPGWTPSRRDSYWVGGAGQGPDQGAQPQQDAPVRLPPVYLRSESIDIQVEDYFAADPGDALKIDLFQEMWARINQGRERIPLLVGIPEGSYYFFPCNPDDGCNYVEELDKKTGPNLVIDRDRRIQPGRYEVYMSASLNDVRVVASGQEPLDTWRRVFQPDFRLLRFDVGSDDQNEILHGTVQLRTFHRLTNAFAIQTQLEAAFRSHNDSNDLAGFLPEFVPRSERGLGNFGTRELQFDIGPVVRYRNFQFALMQSLRRVDRSGWDRSGTVGQFFFNFNYLFNRGQVGVFLTDGNQDNVVVRSVPITPVESEETYLAVTDQIGVNFDVAVGNGVSVEGAFGYLESERNDNAPGGVFRVNLPPLWGRVKLTGEFGINESFVSQDNSWRFGFGVRLGEWGRSNSPRNYLADKGPVPVVVPRVRYETLTRRVRGDNRAPVADAGPDMLDVEPFTRIILDGTNSFDPDDDPLTFLWELQDDCNSETQIQDADEPVASFVIGNGETCSASLTVTDPDGLSDTDVKLVTAIRLEQPVIVEFTADPTEIRVGDASVLTYRVENAEMVNITNVDGNDLDPAMGSIQVMPVESTTYVLTACNAVNECANAEATVLVRPDFPRIVRFVAQDSDLRQGESTTLEWETEGATRVTLTNGGSGEVAEVAVDGMLVVTPEVTTTFVLTATNDRGEVVQASLTIRVRPADLVQIDSFTAEPTELRGSGEVTLRWMTTGATSVLITGVGSVEPDGERVVFVDQTTTFNMTATNQEGEFAEAQATVRVRPPLPRILAFSADPAVAIIGGLDGVGEAPCSINQARTFLSWTTEDASRVELTVPDGTTQVVEPTVQMQAFCLTRTGSFTLRAENDEGESVTSTLTVEVREATPRIFSFSISASSGNPADDPGVFERNTQATLSWDTNFRAGAGWSITISNVTQPIPMQASSSVSVTLTQDTSFTLVLTNGTGESAEATISVAVDDRPVIGSFTVTPAGSFPSTTVRTLSWTTSGAARAQIAPGIGSVPTNGSIQITVEEGTTFRLVAISEKGLVSEAEVEVLVSSSGP